MPDNVFTRLHFIYADRIFLYFHKITDEDRFRFLIDQSGKLLIFLIIAFSASQLQCSNRLRVPGMSYTIASPMKLSPVRQKFRFSLTVSRLLIESPCVFLYLLQANTADCTYLRTEISSQKRLV